MATIWGGIYAIKISPRYYFGDHAYLPSILPTLFIDATAVDEEIRRKSKASPIRFRAW